MSTSIAQIKVTKKIISRGLFVLLICSSPLCAQTKPSVLQKADKSMCTNIVALAGNVNIKCSTLTPEEKKVLKSIPSILNRILTNQMDTDLVISKLDEILAAKNHSTQIVNAPNGIGSIGGTLINPQVNNFGPPMPNLTFTEEITKSLPANGNGRKEMEIHIKTDRAIPGAIIGVIMSAPVIISDDYYSTHGPKIIGSSLTQVNIQPTLMTDAGPIPNSFALVVAMPSTFSVGMDLIVPVQSTSDVHVTQVVTIR